MAKRVLEPVYKVEGGRLLRSTLKQAGDDLTDLSNAHAEAAAIAAKASRSLAPVQSGRLRDSIRSSGTKTRGILRAGFKTVPYAGPIHWGWPTRPNRAKGWRGGPIKPNPFLSQGAQDSEGRWVRVYQDYLDQALDKIKGA